MMQSDSGLSTRLSIARNLIVVVVNLLTGYQVRKNSCWN
jgi:hypothetical protein